MFKLVALLGGGISCLTALGCSGSLKPRSDVPPSQLTLLSSAPLQMSEDCKAHGNYFVEFTVAQNGRTTDIKPGAAEPCVQRALDLWVGSFQYEPLLSPTAARIEWMMVTAQKGS